jgi:hypothetical protein
VSSSPASTSSLHPQPPEPCATRASTRTDYPGSGSFFFWWDWDLNSGLCALLLAPLLPSSLLWLFWRWSLTNSLARLASNLDPPDLSLPSSWDCRREPLRPARVFFLNGSRGRQQPFGSD